MKPKLVVLLLAAVTTLSACETIAGAGRDLQTAGSAVSQSARQTQASM
ncbi:entericidin A/B family lipoprotein [Pararhodobacter sp. CCB-MM2]|nr:entericidin A/B family lipoprotein [Pararhodobacter sp. CCB-MM2]MCA2012578.1 entericidin A/B family lipoprotein [Cereibacter sphaeroides]